MREYSQLSRPYRLSLVLVALMLSGCTSQPDTPECPYQEPQSPASNAGCLIVAEGRVMVVERRFSHKLDIPGGHSTPDESARCTAFRETYEETGHIVRVNELLNEFSNGYRLYRCQTTTPEAPLIIQDAVEISSAFWRSPDDISAEQWRFPDELDLLMKLIKPLANQPAMQNTN